jgi:cobalt-zinc-cadmium efflux system membrane fusion protein
VTNSIRSLAVIPLMAMAVLPLAACGSAPPQDAPTVAAVPAAPADLVLLDAGAQRRAGVVIAKARQVTRSDQSDAPGIVALDETRTARVGSLIEGVVMDVLVQPGTRVRAGQVLARMHSHDVHEAWAGYRKALAEERSLATELRFATEAEARAQRLYADKAVALQDLQRAQASRVAAEEALTVGRTEIQRAEQELEHLGIDAGRQSVGEAGERVPVRSPFNGIVLERLVTQGTAVTPGTPLFVVSDLSTVWVMAEIDEKHLARVQVGRAATVHVAAYPGESFPAKVTYIGETVNPKTRRVTVRCETPNADGRLKPEMYATVSIGESEPHLVITVPAAAVQTINGQTVVFIGESEGQFRVRPIETGPERDGFVEVTRGLAEADPVVAAGAFVLKSELLKPAPDGE